MTLKCMTNKYEVHSGFLITLLSGVVLEASSNVALNEARKSCFISGPLMLHASFVLDNWTLQT